MERNIPTCKLIHAHFTYAGPHAPHARMSDPSDRDRLRRHIEALRRALERALADPGLADHPCLPLVRLQLSRPTEELVDEAIRMREGGPGPLPADPPFIVDPAHPSYPYQFGDARLRAALRSSKPVD